MSCNVPSSPRIYVDIIYTLSAKNASYLHTCGALVCYHALAHLRVPISANLIITDLAPIACTFSDPILPKIKPTILLPLQPK
jgi:hypothetical protein